MTTAILHGFQAGDCLQLLPCVPHMSVPLIICDPPYNLGRNYPDYDDDRPAVEYLTWCERWLSLLYEVVTKDGSFWLFIGPKFVSELDVLAKRIGFHRRSLITWFYTFGVNSTRKFTPATTFILHYVLDPKNFTFNADQIRVPSARQLIYKDKRQNPAGRLPDDTWILRPTDVPGGFPAEGDIWNASRVCGTYKERQPVDNQIPEQLLGRIIRVSSNPGDLVLDPMAGSGSALAVAKKLGRHWLGFELSESTAAIARSRLAAAKEGEPLDGPIPPGG
jgi:DNA modification methylase